MLLIILVNPTMLRFIFLVCCVCICVGYYTPISSGKIAKCEADVLRIGTEVADAFNAPIGNQNWNLRTHQNEIIKRLGFAPWLAGGAHGRNGKTLSGDDARAIHVNSSWIGRNISDSPYAILNHKWVYMYGDSTTRQVWASYAAPFQGNNFERNAKEWTRQYCNRQAHRQPHPKNGVFPNEGWKGPCGVNEVTCYVSGYGDEGLLTFDWKHFPYEDYDEFLWSEGGLFKPNSTERVPDILTIQFGLHTCWHAYPEGLYSDHLKEVNESMVTSHLEGIPKLMRAVREAVDRRPLFNTSVVVVTSGSSYQHKGDALDACILRFNRAAAQAAHDVGFAVLERGEIERRLMYKSLQSDHPFITPEMHLTQPAQNLIATCLLQLLNCLDPGSSVTNDEYGYLGSEGSESSGPPSRPLHTPP